MKIVKEEILIEAPSGLSSTILNSSRKAIYAAIEGIHWPPNSGAFTIRAESGKKRGEGNGVVPIRKAFINGLCNTSVWLPEQPLDLEMTKRPGNVDAVCILDEGPYCVEWETGNISSCHRSLNKMAHGLQRGKMLAGTVIVPSRALYPFLTDRISNFEELIPYLDFWKSIPVERGYLSIIVVEHDNISNTVDRIPKGTDGRALS